MCFRLSFACVLLDNTVHLPLICLQFNGGLGAILIVKIRLRMSVLLRKSQAPGLVSAKLRDVKLRLSPRTSDFKSPEI